MSRNTRIISIIVTVTAIGLIVIVVALLLARARGPAAPTTSSRPAATEDRQEPPSSGSSEPSDVRTAPEWTGDPLGGATSDGVEEADSPQNEDGTFTTVIDPDLDRFLTDEEKASSGYPIEWSVRVKAYAPPGGGDPFPTLTIESYGTDHDQDFLNEAEEEELGTDPYDDDTDGDGLRDGDEVSKFGTDPLRADTDADGFNDAAEIAQRRDPRSPGR